MSTASKDSYHLQFARSTVSALAEVLPEKIAHAVYEFITGPLLDNPQRVGKPLALPLAPAFSARRGDYRVLYFIDDASHTVKVTTIRHRADAYR